MRTPAGPVQLLGLDVGGTLEVTDCFPYPVRIGRALVCTAALAVGDRTSLAPLAP